MRLPALGLLLSLSANLLHAQGVLTAPHAVFIDPRTRSGWIQLHNPGATPAEVSVEALFGYPVTDSAGSLQLYTVDHPDSTAPSAAGWLQIFPKRVMVPAQSPQTIRLMVLPPAGTRDGEYWARIAVSAKAGQVLQQGSGYTASATGLMFLPFAVGFCITSTTSARIGRRLGSWSLDLGAAVMAMALTGLVLLALRFGNIEPTQMLTGFLIYGLGQGLIQPALVSRVVDAEGISADDAGAAAGLFLRRFRLRLRWA